MKNYYSIICSFFLFSLLTSASSVASESVGFNLSNSFTPRAIVDVTCVENNCLKIGWNIRQPTGRFGYLRCNNKNCDAQGWVVTGDGPGARSYCKAGSCFSYGWTELTSNGRVDITCYSGGCWTSGWESVSITGVRTVAACVNKDCRKYGWVFQSSTGYVGKIECKKSDCFKYGWTQNL